MSKMKFTVLGNSGAYPSQESACSGYLVETDRAKILLDCGSGIFARLTSCIDLRDLDVIVISHLHYDHMSDLMVLGYALKINNMGKIKVFMPDSPEAESFSLRSSESFDVTIMDNNGQHNIGGVDISFRQVRHSITTYATKLSCDSNQLVYTGDTVYTPEIGNFARFCDLLVCDAAFTKRTAPIKRHHATAREAGQMAKEAEVAKLLLTHFAPGIDVEDNLSEAKDEFKFTANSEPNMVINI